RVDAVTATLTTVIGMPPSGDGGIGTSVVLVEPQRVAIDAAGNTYVAEVLGQRVRKIAAGTGIITTVVGNGQAASDGDGGPAALAGVGYPTGVAVDSSGNVIVAESNHVRRIASSTGIITTIAGGPLASGGVGGLAVNAKLGYSLGVAIDAADNIYLADPDNFR